jgi:hypothetical protein
MNIKNIITSIAFAILVVIAGCKKDTYKEVKGLCPKVLSTIPSNGSTSVPLNQVISILFNEEMDPATMNTNTITITGLTEIAGTVSFSGETATFIPNSPLMDNTTYTGVVKTSAKDNMGNALQENYIWTFSTGTVIVPMVASTDPANNEIEVQLDKTITATFNMPMDSSTLNNSTFTINNGTSNISGSFSYSNNTLSFNPTIDLTPKTVYTGTITTGAKNLAGVSIAGNYVWKFTTDSIRPPTVILTSPLNLETNVLLDKTITANFSTGMLSSTINDLSFLVTDSLLNPIAGNVSYSGTTASFNPNVNLLSNKKYIVTIKNTVKNLAGVNMVNDYVWSFKTPASIPPVVTSTDPINAAINVKVNKTITATFSQTMNGTTINDLTFLLEEGTNQITGAVSYSGFVGTFNPTSDLKPNTEYKATIKTGAQNLAGLGLATDYVWRFTTTGPSGPPFVDLDCVKDFAVIAGSAVTNTGASIVDGDLGLSPGSSVSGFPPGTIVNGSIRINDTKTNAAKLCLTAAYNDAAGRSVDVIVVSDGQLGGKTFVPGLYLSAPGSFEITGSDFTLDAKGNVDAVWIFQMPSSTLTVGNGIKVTLINGANADNIYWQVGSSATIGTTAEMKGNILADQSITLQTGATLIGRALTRIAAVTLDDNAVTKP